MGKPRAASRLPGPEKLFQRIAHSTGRTVVLTVGVLVTEVARVPVVLMLKAEQARFVSPFPQPAGQVGHLRADIPPKIRQPHQTVLMGK